MEAESNSSAEPPPGGSSHILPAMATVAAVAATNDSSRTEGDAAEDLDGDDEGQSEGDITPQKGEGPGDEGRNGQSAHANSLEKPSSATTNIDNDDGCSAEAKSVCGVASGQMYHVSEDESDTLKSMGKRKDQALLLDSDSDDSNGEGYTHSREDGDDISFEDKQSAEDKEENEEESSEDGINHDSLAKENGLAIEEEAEGSNVQKRNYLPPAPEVYEMDDGIRVSTASKMSRDQIHTSSGRVGKLNRKTNQPGAQPSPAGDTLEEVMEIDAAPDHELRTSMELAGLGYSGKALQKYDEATFMLLGDGGFPEKVQPTAPRPPTDSTPMKDGLISGASLASKGVGPETVPAAGPGDEGFALHGTTDRVHLESEGPALRLWPPLAPMWSLPGWLRFRPREGWSELTHNSQCNARVWMIEVLVLVKAILHSRCPVPHLGLLLCPVP